MNNQKEIHYEVITALSKINELYDHIDRAIDLATVNSFLYDTLHVAHRNLGTTHMKLQVANDLTESL